MSDASTIPARLRMEWLAVATTASVLFVAGATMLSLVADAPILTAPILTAAGFVALTAPIGWLVPTVAVATFELWFCFRHLGLNRPESTDDLIPYRTFGVPNLVTLARGALFAALAGFGALAPRATIVWIPAILYGLGCALDAVDGALARWLDRRTALGSKLDMAFDTIGFLVAPIVAVLWGQLPIWYLSLSAARYLFKFGRGLRRRRGKPVYDLPASRLRRPLAGVQMAFIAVALAPIVPFAPARVGAAVVVLPSLAVFLRDYFAISGRWHNSQA